MFFCSNAREARARALSLSLSPAAPPARPRAGGGRGGRARRFCVSRAHEDVAAFWGRAGRHRARARAGAADQLLGAALLACRLWRRSWPGSARDAVLPLGTMNLARSLGILNDVHLKVLEVSASDDSAPSATAPDCEPRPMSSRGFEVIERILQRHQQRRPLDPGIEPAGYSHRDWPTTRCFGDRYSGLAIRN